MESADPGTVRETVTSIMARDPAFNLDAFLAEAHQAFWLVGQAHAKCRPELCQSVLSPDLAEREQADIDETCGRQANRAPEADDASTGQLVSIQTDANRDTATVHFRSTWRPVSSRGDKEEQRAQNWCFQRSATALTRIGVESDRCRNCGASLQASAGTCRYCGTRIGDESGWRVIRIDDVSQPEAASAVAAMREAIAAIAAERAATQHQRPVVVARRTSAGGWIRRIFWIVVILGGVGTFAAFSSGPVHRAVAKVVPAVRYPVLTGPLNLNGRITAPQVSATVAQPLFQRSAGCTKAAVRTSWDFKAKLQDGSSFHLTIGLPPASGGPGTYHRPQLTIEAKAQNPSATLAWATNNATTADLIIRPDGGGDFTFKNLAAAEGPLNGHLTWTCALG